MSKPDYSGTYHMVEQNNMDAYLEGLGETDACFRFFLKLSSFLKNPPSPILCE